MKKNASSVPSVPVEKTAASWVSPPPSLSLVSGRTGRPLPEQNALEHARRVPGGLPGYVKVGVDQARRALRVRFVFPDAAPRRYSASLAQVEAQTGLADPAVCTTTAGSAH